MQKRLFPFLLILLLIVDIYDGDSKAAESYGVDDGHVGKVTLSGAIADYFEAEVETLKTNDAVVITISSIANPNRVILLSSIFVSKGEYSVPNEFDVIFSDPSTHNIYELNDGIVIIKNIGTSSSTGTLIGSGYGLNMLTFEIDSTKILSISVEF